MVQFQKQAHVGDLYWINAVEINSLTGLLQVVAIALWDTWFVVIPSPLGTCDTCSSSAFNGILWVFYSLSFNVLWNISEKKWEKGTWREWSFTPAKLLLVAKKAYSFEVVFTPLYGLQGLKLSSLVLKASLCLKVFLWDNVGL